MIFNNREVDIMATDGMAPSVGVSLALMVLVTYYIMAGRAFVVAKEV